jgi:hypothetical protein
MAPLRGKGRGAECQFAQNGNHAFISSSPNFQTWAVLPCLIGYFQKIINSHHA